MKKQIEEVGIPYTHPDQLIEDVLCEQIMEKSTKLVINYLVNKIESLVFKINYLKSCVKGTNKQYRKI